MTRQVENAILHYRRQLEQALADAPDEIRDEAVQDASEFLWDEVRAMDVGRLTSQHAAYERFVERFGSPVHLAESYFQHAGTCDTSAPRQHHWGWVAVAILVIAFTMGDFSYGVDSEPPKLSPFTSMDFLEPRVRVTFDGKEYLWMEIDGIKVADVVNASIDRYGDRWKKRVSEDLVEVLWSMNHKPGDTVKLLLRDPANGKEIVIDKAALTESNRRALRDAQMRIGKNQSELEGNQPPKLSPFTGVQFRGEDVLVTYEGKSYRWLGLNDTTVEQIVASAKKQFGDRWQKRVGEDLVEVLWGMDLKPGTSVKLRLHELDSQQDVVIPRAAMTRENRQKIWNASRSRS